jgi:hypothetical protein
MKDHRLIRAVLAAGALFVLQLHLVPAYASVIQYSWSGRLVPSGSDDPWQTGEEGQHFEIEIAVPRTATDLFDLNVEIAVNPVDSARLFLNGQEVTFAGSENIEFTDDASGRFDLVVFYGNFERLGQTIEIGSLVVLPENSFQLSHLIEPPPFFPSTANLDRAACCGGPYTSIVAAGIPVNVVPEPVSTFVGAVLGFVVIVTRRRNRARDAGLRRCGYSSSSLSFALAMICCWTLGGTTS